MVIDGQRVDIGKILSHAVPAALLEYGGLSSIRPHSRAIVPTMRTIWVIFVLALITVAGEIYADAAMTSSVIGPAAPDPATVAVGHAAKPG
jgi:Na+/alanine symporter